MFHPVDVERQFKKRARVIVQIKTLKLDESDKIFIFIIKGNKK